MPIVDLVKPTRMQQTRVLSIFKPCNLALLEFDHLITTSETVVKIGYRKRHGLCAGLCGKPFQSARLKSIA